MSVKLPPPNPVTAEGVRKVLEQHGFQIVASKQVSMDICDLLSDILSQLQLVQFWGDLLAANGLHTNATLEGDCIGISLHAAEKGQQTLVVPFKRLEEALNLPRNWCTALRQFGEDPELRRERIEDTGLAQVQNELLDERAPAILDLLSLAVGSGTA